MGRIKLYLLEYSKNIITLFVIGLVLSASWIAVEIFVPGVSEDKSVGDERLSEERTQFLIHKYINEERRAEDLNALEYDPRLVSIAKGHSEDMAERGYYNHTGPNGSTLENRYKDSGYVCRIPVPGGVIDSGGENIAKTYYSIEVEMPNGETKEYENESELARGIVNIWLNSSEHRENIMQPYWNHEGIGIAKANQTIYATQNFC